MRFLLDANMPQMLAVELRNVGHDVEEVLVWNPRADDPSILQHARDQERILITADLWFGNIRITWLDHTPVSSSSGQKHYDLRK